MLKWRFRLMCARTEASKVLASCTSREALVDVARTSLSSLLWYTCWIIMSLLLIMILLVIGGVERNPGPPRARGGRGGGGDRGRGGGRGAQPAAAVVAMTSADIQAAA